MCIRRYSVRTCKVSEMFSVFKRDKRKKTVNFNSMSDTDSTVYKDRSESQQKGIYDRSSPERNSSRVYSFRTNNKTSTSFRKSYGSHTDDQLNYLASSLLDFDLLNRTIKEWSRPLPSTYMSRPLVLVGPSGVGKGRLVRELLNDYNRFFQKVVTHTTRQPRPDEVNGTSYHFVNNETFWKLFHGNDQFFAENAEVHNNHYGVSWSAWQKVTALKKIPILEVDIKGAKTIRNQAAGWNISPMYLFIAPPSIEMLAERLQRRGTESSEEVALRLRNAETELAEAHQCGFFDCILVNSDFQLSVNKFFRLARDWYPAIPSAARLRMLMRRARDLKALLREREANNSNVISTPQDDEHTS